MDYKSVVDMKDTIDAGVIGTTTLWGLYLGLMTNNDAMKVGGAALVLIGTVYTYFRRK